MIRSRLLRSWPEHRRTYKIFVVLSTLSDGGGIHRIPSNAHHSVRTSVARNVVSRRKSSAVRDGIIPSDNSGRVIDAQKGTPLIGLQIVTVAVGGGTRTGGTGELEGRALLGASFVPF